MLIPPNYHFNQELVGLLQQIERLKIKLDLLPQDKILERYARQKSIFKSALFSAQIEGIEIKKGKQQIEVRNLYKALEFILGGSWERDLKTKDIKHLHRLTLKGVSPLAGSLRQEPSAIFNQAGIAVYICPPPQKIKSLLEKWLDYVNQPSESIVPIKVALAHFSFEKIHPFLDGNGRVGRLFVHLIFKKWHYDLAGLVAFEEYIDRHRSVYYQCLDSKSQEVTPFVEFFLRALRASFSKAVKVKVGFKKAKQADRLPPRRFEILQVIKDHHQVSFDFIQRRFMAVSGRLLRYDLKKLQEAGLIKKRGVTKGVVYEPEKLTP